MTSLDPPLDPDRILALSYVPAPRRPAVAALWHLDAALGRVLAGGREPLISRIKLAWWRESLEQLDRGPAPSEPVLRALAEQVLPDLSGAELAAMEAGWAVLTETEPPGPDELRAYAAARGGLLFRHSAALLGGPAGEDVERAGEGWALVDLARRSADPAEAEAALAAAGEPVLPRGWPPRLRPLGMLALLAARDREPARPRWEPGGSPRRMLRMLRYRLTGR